MKLIAEYQAKADITGLSCHPNGKWIILERENEFAEIIELDESKGFETINLGFDFHYPLYPHDGEPLAVTCIRDEEIYQQQIEMWDQDNELNFPPRTIRQIPREIQIQELSGGRLKAIIPVELSDQFDFIGSLTAPNQDTLFLQRISRSQTEIHCLKGESESICIIGDWVADVLHPGGDLFASVINHQGLSEISFFRYQEKLEICADKFGVLDPINSFDFSPDGKTLVITTDQFRGNQLFDGAIMIVDFPSFDLRGFLKIDNQETAREEVEDTPLYASSCLFTPDSKRFLLANGRGELEERSLKNGDLLNRHTATTSPIWRLTCFDAMGFVVTADNQDVIKIWKSDFAHSRSSAEAKPPAEEFIKRSSINEDEWIERGMNFHWFAQTHMHSNWAKTKPKM